MLRRFVYVAGFAIAGAGIAAGVSRVNWLTVAAVGVCWGVIGWVFARRVERS